MKSRVHLLFLFLFVGLLSVFGQQDKISMGPVEASQAHLDSMTLTEWKRFREFQQRLAISQALQMTKEENLKSYARDSLHILRVKLLAIKFLEEEALLDHDIVENPDYYAALLRDLKESNIKRSEYLFLENKLAFLQVGKSSSQLGTSLWLNMALAVFTVFLTIALVLTRKRKAQLAPVVLSRQENNVKSLILQGKTNKEIADELFISLNTVKTHITNIYSKLKVSSRKELLQKHTGTST